MRSRGWLMYIALGISVTLVIRFTGNIVLNGDRHVSARNTPPALNHVKLEALTVSDFHHLDQVEEESYDKKFEFQS